MVIGASTLMVGVMTCLIFPSGKEGGSEMGERGTEGDTIRDRAKKFSFCVPRVSIVALVEPW